ncbi:MAG: hypothetical protein F9K19_10820 [Rhizobiaceae bacterium]|nr:MAG: hypothetical protein F9K19_10820 [Rhizobiaceae bacterium]CAG0955580.1 hypothetical protein RHIZO_00425 [Rhizobiaceae bacterium]
MAEPSPIATSAADGAAPSAAVRFDRDALETLGRMIDTFVLATVETLCAADAAAPGLRNSPVHKSRVAKVMADLEDVEAAVVKLRAMWAAEAASPPPAPAVDSRSAA